MFRIPSLPSRLLVLALAVCISTAAAQNASSGQREETPTRFDRILIPRLEFREATAAEAFQFLALKAKELGAQQPEPGTSPGGIDPAKLPEVRITLSLFNVSVTEALRHTAALAGVRVTFTADAFRIDVLPGSSLPRLGSRVDDARLSPPQRGILDKAGRIVVPRLQFREATVREAVDFLRKKSSDFDAEEANPGKRGVNVMLITTPNWDGGDRLTLSRENIPLLELLTTIARMSGSELRLSNAAFILDFTDAKAAPATTAP